MTFFTDLPLIPTSVSRILSGRPPLLVLLWAALRFGQRGAATAAFSISKLALLATVLGYGPFVQARLSAGLLPLQTFMATVSAVFLLLGATVVERRLALHEARHAQEVASQANVAKSEFLAVMSHELRTPLNAIAGFAQLLEENVHGTLNEKQADDVARIIRNEKQLLSIVDEVLSFVSVEKGEVTVESAGPEGGRCLRRGRAGDAAGVRARSTSSSSAPCACPSSRCTPTRRACSRFSSGCSRTRPSTRTTAARSRSARIAMERACASGSPIPASASRSEEIKRVFEPFVQGERGTTRRYSGIGLGLSIARTLARRMKWRDHASTARKGAARRRRWCCRLPEGREWSPNPVRRTRRELLELEHERALANPTQLEAVHADHDEAPGREVGAERLGKAEATRRSTRPSRRAARQAISAARHIGSSRSNAPGSALRLPCRRGQRSPRGRRIGEIRSVPVGRDLHGRGSVARPTSLGGHIGRSRSVRA